MIIKDLTCASQASVLGCSLPELVDLEPCRNASVDSELSWLELAGSRHLTSSHASFPVPEKHGLQVRPGVVEVSADQQSSNGHRWSL